MDIEWRNETRRLRDLIPWEHNPREINRKEAERLGDSLSEFGQIQTIAIGPDNEIYDGHQRKAVWSLLPQFGPDHEVDVRVASRTLTEKERQKLVVYLHRGTTGAWNFDELANTFEVDELLEWGFEEADLQLDWGKDDATPDPGAQVDKAAELQEKWQCARGQVWEVGRHRVMCGDSTSAEDVARLMDGERAQAVVTDPPFGVRGDEWDTFGSEQSFIDFTARWLSVGKRFTDVVVSFMADKNVPPLFVAAAQADWSYRRALIWRKPPGSQFAGASLDGFWFDFEIVQVFGNPTFAPRKDTQMAVLEHRTVTGQEHGCEKPIPLLCQLVEGYSQPDKAVLDQFSATGTTLVACEQAGRIGYGMEIEPKYVAVTLERLTGMGLEARLIHEITEGVA